MGYKNTIYIVYALPGCMRQVYFVIFFVAVTAASGQNTISPYSIFGPGEIQNQGFTTNQAMGGAGISLNSGNALNRLNPASCTGIDSLHVISEIGAGAKFSGLSTSSHSETGFSGSLKYLALGFRYSGRFAGSIGVAPFSHIGYSIEKENYVEGTNAVYIAEYVGSGGINQFYFTNAFEVARNLSVGVNTSFMFGSLMQEEKISPTDIVPQMQITRMDYLKSIYFDYGLQYMCRLKKLDVSFGATYSHQQKLKSKHIVTVTNESYSTVGSDEYNSDHLIIPQKFGFGIGLENKGRYVAAFDYELQQWSGVEYPIQYNDFVNSHSFSFGIQVNPWEQRVINKSFKNWDYRFGVNYKTSYLKIGGRVIDDKSISLGLGIPLSGNVSKMNLTFKAGIAGTTDNNLILEKYALLQLGFSLNEFWFIRRRYD